MKKVRDACCRSVRALYGYTIALAVLSLSLIMMPIVNGIKEKTKIPMYAVGVLFWVGLIMTVVMAVRINNARKRDTAFQKRRGNHKKMSLIHFFQNKKALVSDVAMLASLTALVVACFTTENVFVHFSLVSLLVFSFGMHCILNGVNYNYIEFKKTVRRG